MARRASFFELCSVAFRMKGTATSNMCNYKKHGMKSDTKEPSMDIRFKSVENGNILFRGIY